jgi:hypothetical protein
LHQTPTNAATSPILYLPKGTSRSEPNHVDTLTSIFNMLRLLIYFSTVTLVVAVARPQTTITTTYTAPGQCTSPGQFVCVGITSYAICDYNLMGVIQNLSPGDVRCGATGTEAWVTTPIPDYTVHASSTPTAETASKSPGRGRLCESLVGGIFKPCLPERERVSH